MKHFITSHPSRYGGFASSDKGSFVKAADRDDRFRETDHITLVIDGTRYGVAFTGPAEANRVITNGPILVGPHAETYGLCSVLTAEPYDPDAGQTVIKAAYGDVLIIDSFAFRLEVGNDSLAPYPALVRDLEVEDGTAAEFIDAQGFAARA